MARKEKSHKNMSKNNHEVETTVYHHGAGVREVVPVTVVSESDYSPVKGHKCLAALGVLEVLLGLCIIALEAACVGLDYFLEKSAVGIYVGCFTFITGLITLAASRSNSTKGMGRCCFLIAVVFSLFCALKAFIMFCASAAMLAIVLTWYYNYRNGGTLNNTSFNFLPTNPFFNNWLSPNYYLSSGRYGNNPQVWREMIGLEATVMTLYFILFMLAIIATGFSCWNCCAQRKERQMIMTVYPDRQRVVQQKV
ncbi:uncharacterized protein LOC129581270 [Paramacrobiotus metropolitanus]|uniref:uncharacterized protein LOC129581270 n=1 Tax=Paramacrobiotus metropolitanus TaxID=2943436 RepID=UPI002446250A|nr:uncharacterized protein LOC129581270 [Paramacrobiotus metropolitanus]